MNKEIIIGVGSFIGGIVTDRLLISLSKKESVKREISKLKNKLEEVERNLDDYYGGNSDGMDDIQEDSEDFSEYFSEDNNEKTFEEESNEVSPSAKTDKTGYKKSKKDLFTPFEVKDDIEPWYDTNEYDKFIIIDAESLTTDDLKTTIEYFKIINDHEKFDQDEYFVDMVKHIWDLLCIDNSINVTEEGKRFEAEQESILGLMQQVIKISY